MFTTQHYMKIALIILAMDNRDGANEVAHRMSVMFREDNSRFDTARFSEHADWSTEMRMTSPAIAAIDEMPELKRAYAQKYWAYLTGAILEAPIVSMNISLQTAIDVRMELAMYCTKTGEKLCL